MRTEAEPSPVVQLGHAVSRLVPATFLTLSEQVSRAEEQQIEAAPERNAAKEQLVGAVAATWGASAAEQALPRITAALTDAETRAVLDELARSILAEAGRRFSDPVLAEVWREAANEAACSRLSALE